MNADQDVRGTASWPSRSRRSRRRSRTSATHSWPAGWSTCRSAVGSSNVSITAIRWRRRERRGARWRSAPGSARTSRYENLENQQYYAIELLQELADSIEEGYPGRHDARRRLPEAPSIRRRILRSGARDPRPRAPARPAGRTRRGRARTRPRGAVRRGHPMRGRARLLPGAAVHLEAAVRAGVRPGLRLVHPLGAHQRALGNHGRAREAVPRRRSALLPAADPDGQPSTWSSG